MKGYRLRLTMLGLMGLVALGALASLGLREWEKRHGAGAPFWSMAMRYEHLAKHDLAKAREYRECPRDHTPWKTRFQCPGCLSVPATIHDFEHGKPPIFVPKFMPDSKPGRALTKQNLEQHEAVAREYEAEASLCRRLRDRYEQAASRPTLDPLPMTDEQKQLDQSNGLSHKYRYDWY